MNKDFFTKNIALKLFSLVMAIILWFVVINVQNPVTTKTIRNIPIEIKNLDYAVSNGLYISNLDDNQFDLTVRGPVLDIQTVTRNKISAQIDLKKLDSEGYVLRKGKVKVPLQVTGLPLGIQVDGRPSEFTLIIESLQTKQKTVDVFIEGMPAQGYIRLSPSVEPNMIQLEGPESKMANISQVIVNVNVDNKSSQVTAEVPVKILDKEGNQILGLAPSSSVVRVEVPIFKTKKVPLTYELTGNVPQGYTITNTILQPKEVIIAGKDEDINEVDEISIGKFDAADWIQNKEFSAVIVTPPGVVVVDKNKNATLQIEVEPVIIQEVSVPVTVQNLPSSLKLKENVETVKIFLQGTVKQIEEVKEEINAIVDLENSSAGAQKVEVQVSIEQEEVVLQGTPTVDVVLEEVEQQE